MSFEVGEHIIYCSKEICLINKIVEKCFDGINKEKYLQLVPIDTKNSFYYVPCSQCELKIRPLLTKDQVYSLIDEIPNISSVSANWCEDKRERKNMFNSVLKSDDYHRLIAMIHSLHVHRDHQILIGKKLPAADERAMSEAEHLIHREFAFVLNIKEDDVVKLIQDRLEHVN